MSDDRAVSICARFGPIINSRVVTVTMTVALGLMLCLVSRSAVAIDGANPLQLTTLSGWNAFELVTQGDDISAIVDAGYGNTVSRGTFDGLGAHLTPGNLSVYINHETSSAAISRLDLGLVNLQTAIQSTIDGGVTAFPSSMATGFGYAYDAIYASGYHAINNPNPDASGTVAVGNFGNSFFDRFCSGTSHQPDTFGSGTGFADQLYLTGEEVSNGLFYALDQATGDLWEVDDLGAASWENAALVDTGNTTHVALVLSSDVGGSPGDYLRLYVGEKGIDDNSDGEIDFLERNGLTGGTVYYFDPDGAASTTDLPDGLVTGTWNVSSAGALLETKLEDIHTNPANGTEVVFADQNDGLYVMDLTMQFAGGVFDTVASTVSIDQIDDDDVAPIGAPDNLTWAANQKIYVQEDGDGDDIWEINPDGTGQVQIASASSEPSGIFDISRLVNYQPGSILLTSMQGSGGADAQLAVLVSPTATACIVGDANCDGYVDVGNDIFPAFANFTGPGSFGMARAQGDVQSAVSPNPIGDGDVDVSDIITMFANFTGPAPPDEAGGLVAAEALDSTIPDLIYDASTGEVLLDLDSAVGFTGYVLNSANGFITGNHTPFMAGVTTTLPYELAEATFGTPAGPYPKSIGQVFPSGMDMTALSAFLTGNQVSRGNNQPIVPFDLVIVNPVSSGVPEPAAVVMGLMALAGLGMVAYRRRNTT